MFDETTAQMLIMAVGVTAAVLSILMLTAMLLAAELRHCWRRRDRWDALEREAMRDLAPARPGAPRPMGRAHVA
jgi:hypothetical protein